LRETQQDALSILILLDAFAGFANLHEFSDQPADLPPTDSLRRLRHDVSEKLSVLLGLEPICGAIDLCRATTANLKKKEHETILLGEGLVLFPVPPSCGKAGQLLAEAKAFEANKACGDAVTGEFRRRVTPHEFYQYKTAIAQAG